MTADATPQMLGEHTTFRVGGPARRFVAATTLEALIGAVQAADAADEPVFVLSGGSNVVVGDAGFPGTVVHVGVRGVMVIDDKSGTVTVSAWAGERWDDLVAMCVASGWSGLEALSGIPGLVGATPVQNVGAYGAEVAQTIVSVRAYDRRTGVTRTFEADECGFGYRDSMFKRSRAAGQASGRYVVVNVAFRLAADPLSAPIRYAELARTLDVAPGARVPLADVRAAVLALRRSKAMLVDDADHDTWSAGSFFTNPILPSRDAARLPGDAPRFPQDDGTVKTSAAWLIEHAGIGKGYGVVAGGHEILAPGPGLVASTSTRHVLALTNRGGATASDVLALAGAVQARVRERFGIDLVPEPVLVATGEDAPASGICGARFASGPAPR